jgi:hypothetical protein
MTLRNDRLRALNDSAAELTTHCVERFDAGLGVADAELRGIETLAQAVRRALGEWRTLIGDLELAQPLVAGRAGALILETVFDEALAPPAWRVLSGLIAVDAP